MSLENNEFAPSEKPQNSGKSPRKSSAMYWAVIVILLGICIYLFVSKRNAVNNGEMSEQQLGSVRTDSASLQNDFNAASQKIDQLLTQNVKMDSTIQNKQGEILKLKDQIKGILSKSNASAADLKHARELIDELNSKTKSYEERIAELEKENTNLTGENKQLGQERDSTVTQNIALKKIGSVLHASNMRMEPMHKRRNGKEKETTKAKKVDAFHITFDIDENRIAENGTKQLYLRIKGPDGKVLSNPAYGSGTLTASDGSQVDYTLVKEIALVKGQPVNDVTVDWNQDNDYLRGAYSIEIYNEGYKIGSGTVTLR